MKQRQRQMNHRHIVLHRTACSAKEVGYSLPELGTAVHATETLKQLKCQIQYKDEGCR